MTSGIYLITNKLNGHMYVGGSVDIENRFKEHKKYKNLNCSAIDRAIKKYGADNFVYQIITELPPDWKIIGEHEKYWIKFYNTFKDSSHYNLTEGGEGISGFEHTPETKTKISKTNKDHLVSNKTKQKISKANKGKKPWNKCLKNCFSSETIQKMSESHKGKNIADNHHAYKNYARILKMKDKTKQGFSYFIQFNGKKLKQSIYLHKLYKWWGINHPNELLYLEI